MSKPENILLQLTSRALFNAPTDFDPTTVDWHALYQEATAQALSLLIWDTLSDEERDAIPDDIKFRWEQDSFRYIMSNEQLLYEQEQVIQILEEASIPCAILKGSSSAMYYPDPALRIMGDIDLLVKPEQQLEAVEVLQKDGYYEDSNESHPFHKHLSKEQIAVEIHREPNGIYLNENPDGALELRTYFDDAIERRQYIGGLPVLADDQQAIVLLLHKLGHFLNSGLGLRQLCDWAVFVEKRLTPELWEKLELKLREFGIMYFTGVMTRACIEALGLPEKSAPWAMQYDAELVNDVIEKIMKEGNCGHKVDKYGERLFSNPNTSNRISSFFHIVVSTSRQRWPICKKYPVLMLVAPFVLLAKYLRQYKKGERPKLNLKKKYDQAGANQKLYRELKLFVVE